MLRGGEGIAIGRSVGAARCTALSERGMRRACESTEAGVIIRDGGDVVVPSILLVLRAGDRRAGLPLGDTGLTPMSG